MVNKKKGMQLDYTYPTLANIVAGQTTPFALDVNALIQSIDIRVSGSVTLANYTTAPTVRAEAPENSVAQVNFSGNSKVSGTPTVNFSSTDYSYLRFKTALMRKTFPSRTQLVNTNGTNPFVTNATKFFGAMRIKGISDATYLDARNLQALTLNLTGAPVAALVDTTTGVAGTATLNAVTAQIHAVQWVGGAPTSGAPYISETQRTTNIANQSGLLQLIPNIPIGNILLRNYFKGTVGDSAYGDPSDAFYASTYRTSGALMQTTVNKTVVKLNAAYTAMQEAAMQRYGLSSFPTGYNVYEYSRTGLITDALNLSGNNITSAENWFDLTPVANNTNILTITDEQLVAA